MKDTPTPTVQLSQQRDPDLWLVIAMGDHSSGEPDEVIAVLPTGEDAAHYVAGFCDGAPGAYCQIRTANFGDYVGLGSCG